MSVFTHSGLAAGSEIILFRLLRVVLHYCERNGSLGLMVDSRYLSALR